MSTPRLISDRTGRAVPATREQRILLDNDYTDDPLQPDDLEDDGLNTEEDL